jgi:hypothetical protein
MHLGLTESQDDQTVELETNMNALNNENLDEIKREAQKKILADKKHYLKDSLKISKGLFFICFAFSVSIFPFKLVVILESVFKIPSYFHLYSFLLIRLCSIFNPILHAYYNSSFEYGYRNMFHMLLNKGKKYSFSNFEKILAQRSKEQKKKEKERKMKRINWLEQKQLII